MKEATNNFKTDIRTYGRQLDFEVRLDDEIIENDRVNYIKPSFNTKLFKTVMHKLEIDLKDAVGDNTKINIKAGVKLNGDYEYVEYNTYKAKRCERQEDTNSYIITAYDKMVESMFDYDLNLSKKITLRDYLLAICQRLNWSTEHIPSDFINSNKLIDPNLHEGIKYTFRDALDEIATISCSFLYFKGEDFYLAYPTETNENIDESYLDEDNIKIGEKYIINSLVFSRAGGSDNIYRKDNNSIAVNGLHEFKVSDNQLLSTNERDDYIDEMFNYLKNFEFYVFDVKSKGILFLEICDRFSYLLGENTYPTILLNDETTFEDGLTEDLYTDQPEETETEYKYADETDRRINQTYLIVDKQSQVIESVISNVNEQNTKISRVQQTVDSLNSKISDIADITISQETQRGTLTFERINQSEPIHIEIRPIGENVSYLYPFETLAPSDTLYIKLRTLRFTNTDTNEVFDYELPDDLLFYDNDNYDEFIYDYDSQTIYVNKKCRYNSSTGAVELLAEPVTNEYTFQHIYLTDGDYTVQILKYDNTSYICYLMARLMTQNQYTAQYSTKAELNSEINQSADSIKAEVNQTLSSYATTSQMNSAINLKANEITSSVSNTYATKTALNTATSTLNSTITQTADSITSSVASTYETKTNAGNTYATKTQLNTAKSEIKQTTDSISSTVSTKVGNNEIISKINQSAEAVTINANKININGTVSANGNFKVDTSGNMTCKNATVTGNITATSGKIAGYTINGNMLVGANVGISGKSGEGWAFWAGSNDAGSSPFKVGHDGSVYASNANIQGTVISNNATITGGKFNVSGYGSTTDLVRVTNSDNSSQFSYLQPIGAGFVNGDYRVDIFTRGEYSEGGTSCSIDVYDSRGTSMIRGEGIRTPKVTQTSLSTEKKNFEKFEKALEIIKDIDIYKYNLKNEDNETKKHIGFVIGDNFNYSKEVTSNEDDGVDLYSFASLCCKAIQEQQVKIDKLEQEIKTLREER